VQFTAGAYEAAEKSGSFWAVAGQARSLSLRYQDTGAEFMRFRVGANALDKQPDGSAFLPGDSILIEVTVAEDGTMRFEFQPSGLQFNPYEPAELTVLLHRADLDLLHKLSTSVWKREFPGLPWLKIPTIHLDTDEVESDVPHFTEFGMAVN
jgi:hypothetical protein